MISYTITTDKNTEENAIKRAMLADEAFETLSDMKQKLRECWKYGHYTQKETINLVEELYEHFNGLICDNGVNLDLYYN